MFLKDFNSKIVQLALEKTLENEEVELATLCKAAPSWFSGYRHFNSLINNAAGIIHYT